MIPKEIFRLLFKIFAILEETVGMILELFEEQEEKPAYRDDGPGFLYFVGGTLNRNS